MTETQITKIIGREVWDSRGRPTVEAEVHLANGSIGRAIAPSGASTGRREALDLRDGGKRLGGHGVNQAITSVRTEIADALIGYDAVDQSTIDRCLIRLDGTPQKTRLGGNALVAVSSAVSWAAASGLRTPLWRHLAGLAGLNPDQCHIPIPMIQIFGGGAHAHNRIDIQDFLIICNGADSFSQSIEWTAEVYRAASSLMKARGSLMGVCDEGGLWPDFHRNEEVLQVLTEAITTAGFSPRKEISIALDVAASEFHKDGAYQFILEDRRFSTDEMVQLLQRWCEDYPINSLEDPLHEDDKEGFIAITEKLGGHVQIIGDDYLTTNAKLIQKAGKEHACNAVLLKSNQCGTITELIEASQAAKAANWNTIMSGRSGESEDVTLSHLAIGLDSGQIKVGSVTRSERTCKWNEVLRIEETSNLRDFWKFQLL
ncbi:MAG: phosphopyruvate hydratase [Opitutaceae bacterium]|nr:phosphopyruvate hydratase [Opitutaceae bacterium]